MIKFGNIKISLESIGSLVLFSYFVTYLNPDWYNMNFLVNNGPVIACLCLYVLAKVQIGTKFAKYELYIFAYILISLFSYLLSTTPAISNPYFRDVGMNSIVLLYLYQYAAGSEEKTVKLMNFYIFSAAIMCIYIFITAGISNIISSGVGVETMGKRWNANSISCRLVLAISFIGYIMCYKKDLFAKRKAYYILALTMLSFCVIFSGSRTGLILYGGIIASILYASNRRRLLFGFGIGVFSIFVLYQLVMNVETLYNIIGYRIRNLILFINDQQADENSIYIRQSLIERGVEWFKERPIFGYGIGTFSHLNNDGYYAHNGYIELLVGMGLVGTITFFMPLVSVVRESVKNKICVSSKYILLIMLLILVAAYSSVISYNPFYSIVICIYFVAIHASEKKETSRI